MIASEPCGEARGAGLRQEAVADIGLIFARQLDAAAEADLKAEAVVPLMRSESFWSARVQASDRPKNEPGVLVTAEMSARRCVDGR